MKYTIWVFLLLLIVSCENEKPQKSVFQGQAFGTAFTIQVYSDNEIDFEKGIDSVFYKVNKSVSTYLPESDISKINSGDTSITVDDVFIDNFNISSEVYRATGGIFDPTIGVLRNAYGFGDTKPLKEIDSLALDSMLTFVGFNKVKLTSENKIEKQYPEIYFDFNAVAKGYGIDLIGNYLESKGISNYLIELGGEILAKGENIEKNKVWVVGIENVTGTYIAFLDADDYFHNNAIEIFYKNIIGNNADLSIGQYVMLDKNENVLKKSNWNNNATFDNKTAISLVASEKLIPTSWAKLFKSKIAKKCSFPNLSWKEDDVFFFSIFIK